MRRGSFHGALQAALALIAAAAPLVSGCSSDGHDDEDRPGPVPGPAPTLGYAPGPYGATKGDIITNYEFDGFVDASIDRVNTVKITLADFYNPTGDAVYAEDSAFPEGEPKPLALLINVSAVWCGPCRYEAEAVLPDKYAAYRPRGGEFLLELADGPTPGTPAELKHLQAWTSQYDVDYPGAIDPKYQLGALFDADAYPANMIVDTRTMAIVDVISGAPDDAFWSRYEQLLAP